MNERINRIAEELKAEGLDARMGPSGIQGSPYDHCFVLLTDAGFEGRIIIISEERELNGPDARGVIVGLYEDPEDGPVKIETVPNEALAVRWALETAREGVEP